MTVRDVHSTPQSRWSIGKAGGAQRNIWAGTGLLFAGLLLTLVGPADAANRLPKSMLGKWALEFAACSEQSSELALRVEPRLVLFYEHGYEVRRVVRRKDGSFKASGFSVDDDVRARGSITLKLVAADQLQVAGGEIYHRCKEPK